MSYLRHESNSREKYGNYLVSGQYKHRVYTPKATNGDRKNIIRIYPAVINGENIPQVVPVDGDPRSGIGDSFFAMECVSFLGQKTNYQFATETSDYPNMTSPTLTLIRRIENFVKDNGKKKNPEWSEWVSKPKMGFSRPSVKMLIQGILTHLDGMPTLNKNTGTPEPIFPVIMALPKSATVTMESALTTRIDDTEDISAQNSQIGDITSYTGGGALVIQGYNIEDREKSGRLTLRYRVFRTPDTHVLSEAQNQYVPWSKLIPIRNAAWQIERLVEAFGPVAVDYSFRDSPIYADLMPAGVAGSCRFDDDGEPIATTIVKPDLEETEVSPDADDPGDLLYDPDTDGSFDFTVEDTVDAEAEAPPPPPPSKPKAPPPVPVKPAVDNTTKPKTQISSALKSAVAAEITKAKK
jgi:hypothetical protein